jgi:hypothetical protein
MFLLLMKFLFPLEMKYDILLLHRLHLEHHHLHLLLLLLNNLHRMEHSVSTFPVS